MHHPATRLFWIVAAFVCLGLGACDAMNPVSPQVPSNVPSELSIEAHTLKEMPQTDDSRAFSPVESTEEEILSKHESERSKIWPISSGLTFQVSLAGDQITAAPHETNSGDFVQVSRNGTVIFTVPTSRGYGAGVSPLRGLWVYDNHWILEVVHSTERFSLSNEIDFDVWGEVIQDGVSLNQQYEYQETFGYQLIHGQPFYFFNKQGQIGVSYKNQAILLGYTQVQHYRCCSGAQLNPKSAKNMVAFFAQRGGLWNVGGTWYYVEIGVFE